MLAAPHPLAERIHNQVLQLIGSAMLQVEMCEQLSQLGRQDEVPPLLGELRSALEQAVVELRTIMTDLRAESLKHQAA